MFFELWARSVFVSFLATVYGVSEEATAVWLSLSLGV